LTRIRNPYIMAGSRFYSNRPEDLDTRACLKEKAP
jgi:hypothetical protein